MNEKLSALANYLQSQQSVILDRWKQECEADDALGVVSRLTREEFRNNIFAAIDGLCRVLTAGSDEASSDVIRTEVAKHGHHRWKQGFSLMQLIRDWGILNRVLVGMIEEYLQKDSPVTTTERTKALDRLAAFMTEATSSSVRRFDALRRAEAASVAKDLNAAKEQFEKVTETRGQLLREAAHDIRGGLSAIAGASEALKLSQSSNESFAAMLEVLDRGVQSVKQMLNSLLDLSRLESGADNVELLSVNIADVLSQLATEYTAVASGKGLILSSNGPKELFVQTDPQKVRRIAQNLIVNALQQTSHGEVRLSWSKEETRWIMRVSDTGPGIQNLVGAPVAQELDEQDLDREASTLETSHPHRGEGIGLTIMNLDSSVENADKITSL